MKKGQPISDEHRQNIIKGMKLARQKKRLPESPELRIELLEKSYRHIQKRMAVTEYKCESIRKRSQSTEEQLKSVREQLRKSHEEKKELVFRISECEKEIRSLAATPGAVMRRKSSFGKNSSPDVSLTDFAPDLSAIVSRISELETRMLRAYMKPLRAGDSNDK